MHKFVWLIGIIVLCAGIGAAQQHNAHEGLLTGEVDGTAAGLSTGLQIAGELQSALDVGTAAAGDQVVLIATDDVTANGRVIAKKGSRLIGQVTAVDQGGNGGDSKIAISFDRLENGSDQMPLRAIVSSVIIPTGRVTSGLGVIDSGYEATPDSLSRPETIRSSVSTSAIPLPDTMAGRAPHAASSSPSSFAGRSTSNTSPPVGGMVNATGQTVANVSGVQTSPLDDLRIEPASNDLSEGTTVLSITGPSLHFEKGTLFLIRVK